jgi:hypothetical protein
MAGPLYDELLIRRTVSPATRANGTVNGVAVNLGPTGADSAVVAFVTGAITDGSHAAAIEESDTGTGGWTAVPAGRLQGAVPTITTSDNNTQFEVGVTVAKQYLRAVVVTTGATTGGVVAAVIAAGQPGQTPVSHA